MAVPGCEASKPLLFTRAALKCCCCRASWKGHLQQTGRSLVFQADTEGDGTTSRDATRPIQDPSLLPPLLCQSWQAPWTRSLRPSPLGSLLGGCYPSFHPPPGPLPPSLRPTLRHDTRPPPTGLQGCTGTEAQRCRERWALTLEAASRATRRVTAQAPPFL